MRGLVHVRGTVDELELWPYVSSVSTLADGSIISIDVSDGKDLVSVLVALTDRGLELISVQTLDAATPHAESPHDPRAVPRAARDSIT